MKIKQLVAFPTIDQCVVHLTSLGCEWDHKREQELNDSKGFAYNGVLVLYDKHDILHV